jgi:NADH:ubiquinone oxidoreductase subunit 6 (subunit J)
VVAESIQQRKPVQFCNQNEVVVAASLQSKYWYNFELTAVLQQINIVDRQQRKRIEKE